MLVLVLVQLGAAGVVHARRERADGRHDQEYKTQFFLDESWISQLVWTSLPKIILEFFQLENPKEKPVQKVCSLYLLHLLLKVMPLRDLEADHIFLPLQDDVIGRKLHLTLGPTFFIALSIKLLNK